MDLAQKIVVDDRFRARSVIAEASDRRLVVEWADGRISRFPYIWLRHACFFPVQGRPEQAPDAAPLLVEDPDLPVIGGLAWDDVTVSIDWSHDGSTTRHDLADLRRFCISDAARAERSPPAKTWTANDALDFPWFTPGSLDKPEERLAVFEHLMTRGIVLLRGFPTDRKTLFAIADRFGPIRRTHFGDVFDIRSTPQDNLGNREKVGATAHNAQAPHTDESYRHGPPGISVFHCLKPHPGGQGASIFLDGFKAAERLRMTNPDAFSLLSTTPVMYRAERNAEERFRTWQRMIATDHNGAVRGVAVSDRTLAPLSLPEDRIEPAYRAIRAFEEQLAATDLMFERLLEPGEVVIFDNHRILHARRAFDPMAGERHLQQVAVDREEFHNVMRLLAGKCGREDLANLDTDSGVLTQR
ncbi:MAG: TauD/TfdA family dioxygenase [Alphaproteobacteria bacterium]